ncbi:MAG: CoA-binding protein [Chitinophagales bacterium]|nr:CoA-binding protein [Chitinophagales bacterium]
MKTLVIGASQNPERYSFKAINMLREYGHEVVALSTRAGTVKDIVFDTEKMAYKNIDTVTLYINPQIQKEYYTYIISLKPRRVIFNPGTENEDFEALLKQNGIESVIACTLVLLRTNQFEL